MTPRSDPREYWRRNLRLVGVLLTIWFLVSYGAGILFVEPLNEVRIPGTGFPLGFWFAQQGAIYVFVILIFVYVFRMNRLDREFDVDEGSGNPEPAGSAGGRRASSAGRRDAREPPGADRSRASDGAEGARGTANGGGPRGTHGPEAAGR